MGVRSWLFGENKVEIDPEKARLEGGEDLRRRTRGYMDDVTGRGAPQAGRTGIDPVHRMDETRQGQFRQQQMAMANRLARVGAGQAQGAGELAANRAVSRGLAAQQAMARMGRGSNAAVAQRSAARAGADLAGQGAGMAQEAALRDQASANAALGGLLAQGRGADIGIAQANMTAENQRIFQQAGLDQNMSLANMQAKLATMGMNDQASLAYLAQLYNVSLAEMQARMEQDKMRIAQRSPGMMGDLLAAGGQLGAAAIASDRRLKTKVAPGDQTIRDLLGGIAPFSWDYKDEKHGEGRHVGVMAQDLEKSELGASMVTDTPDGKMVDVKKALSAALASAAHLNARLSKVEGKG